MIRPYKPEDAKALERIFERQAFEYQRPDADDPSFVSKMIAEKNGAAGMAILARLTAEAYFLVDPDFGTPLEKWEAFKELHEASRLDCYARGLDDIYCYVPPRIARPFSRRLLRLGWERNLWPSFNRSLRLPTVDAKEQLCESVT